MSKGFGRGDAVVLMKKTVEGPWMYTSVGYPRQKLSLVGQVEPMSVLPQSLDPRRISTLTEATAERSAKDGSMQVWMDKVPTLGDISPATRHPTTHQAALSAFKDPINVKSFHAYAGMLWNPNMAFMPHYDSAMMSAEMTESGRELLLCRGLWREWTGRLRMEEEEFQQLFDVMREMEEEELLEGKSGEGGVKLEGGSQTNLADVSSEKQVQEWSEQGLVKSDGSKDSLKEEEKKEDQEEDEETEKDQEDGEEEGEEGDEGDGEEEQEEKPKKRRGRPPRTAVESPTVFKLEEKPELPDHGEEVFQLFKDNGLDIDQLWEECCPHSKEETNEWLDCISDLLGELLLLQRYRLYRGSPAQVHHAYLQSQSLIDPKIAQFQRRALFSTTHVDFVLHKRFQRSAQVNAQKLMCPSAREREIYGHLLTLLHALMRQQSPKLILSDAAIHQLMKMDVLTGNREAIYRGTVKRRRRAEISNEVLKRNVTIPTAPVAGTVPGPIPATPTGMPGAPPSVPMPPNMPPGTNMAAQMNPQMARKVLQDPRSQQAFQHYYQQYYQALRMQQQLQAQQRGANPGAPGDGSSSSTPK